MSLDFDITLNDDVMPLDVDLSISDQSIVPDVGEVTEVGTSSTDHSKLTNLDYDSSGHTGFVKAVEGKGLSTNDYDNTEKALVASAIQPDDNVSELTNDAGYLTEHQSLSNYDTKEEVNTKISTATTDMATKTWVGEQGYLTEHQSLAEYRKAADQDTIDSGKQATLVSGTNIKTINNASILGSGDLTIGGNVDDVKVNGTSVVTDKVANVTVPTKTSDITNDSGYITKAVDNLENYTPTSDLATVAISGSYNDLSNKPSINDATLTIQKNGVEAGTFTANASVDKEINILVPTKTSDITNDSGFLTEHQSLADYRKSADQDVIDTAQNTATAEINAKIPSAASSSNQLADKAFVNSSISTETATFRGTSAKNLTEAQFLEWANGLEKTKNDYVFWDTVDSEGNSIFKRYKYDGTNWVYEYTLNNSSFTSAQWAAVNSGITSNLVTSYNTHIADTDIHVTASDKSTWTAKQDTISTDKGIVKTNDTIALTDEFYNYLENATYKKPTIAAFYIRNAAGSNVHGDYELGSTVTVAKINHYETNPGSVSGNLNIKKGSTVVQTTPAVSTATDVALGTAIDVTSSTTFYLAGTDTKSTALSSSRAINFYRYAYTALSTSETAPTSGTKRSVISTFASSGVDITYTAGQYLYLYTTTSGKTVATYVAGSWASVESVESGPITFTQANGTTYNYYAYRIGPFIASGTAKYRV